MIHEEINKIDDPRIPKGYAITYHEMRGYDSPDRWYEACYRKKLGDFGSFSDALTACQEHRLSQLRKAGPVKGRTPKKPDRRQVERRADKRRQDDKTKARLKQ